MIVIISMGKQSSHLLKLPDGFKSPEKAVNHYLKQTTHYQMRQEFPSHTWWVSNWGNDWVRAMIESSRPSYLPQTA